MSTDVEIWADPVCPWTWLTTRWLAEVETVRPIRVRYHLMSLSALNEGRTDIPEFYQKGVARWWGPARVIAAAAHQHGEPIIRPLYEALARRLHVEDQRADQGLYEAALREAGLPVELAAAATDEAWNDEVRTRHRQAAVDPADAELGSPTIQAPGPDGTPVAFFGPVVNPAPTGEAAGRLWDGTLLVIGTPGFSEIKRTRIPEPIVR
ncbi:MAG TPA: disulfide bond formation protein DsbA [Mycobacteriales bacterium]|nr:disulfide bond formation protein DsbA [Mycobacteriales bacterium]